MDWLQLAVQWLHVFLGVFWFGSTLYVDFVLIPGLQTLTPGKAREAGAAVGAQGVKVILPVAVLTILLGVIRGTVFGPIKSLEALGTIYGITWLVALELIGFFIVFTCMILMRFGL